MQPSFSFTLDEEEVGTTPFALEALLATSEAQITAAETDLLRRHYRRNHWPLWRAHEDVNTVMLATALHPEGWLTLAP